MTAWRSLRRGLDAALVAPAGRERVLEPAVGGLQLDRGREEAGEAVPGVGRLEGPLGRLGELGEARVDDRVDERVLRREVAVQRAHPDARAARDLVHADVEPALLERGTGRGDDPVAIALGVLAERGFRGGRHAVQCSAPRVNRRAYSG